jgi:PIN domain nuclease of toxin-antitoxin system
MAKRFLIDTHCALWWANDPTRLSAQVTKILSDPSTEIYFSSVSSLEIAIKVQIGKLQLPVSVGEFVSKLMESENFLPVNITHEHSAALAKLPMYHRDPFDRILIAQAQVEEMTVLTRDKNFKQYKISVLY